MSRTREVILDLEKHMNKRIRIRFQGGREVRGTLKGFDPLVNVVLSEAEEFLRDPKDPNVLTEKTRKLGLLVARGNSVMLICPDDGMETIANPWEEEAVIDGGEE